MTQRKRAGFTLIELMVVVVIISIGLVAFQPSFSMAMAQRRAGLLARELVRLGRRAQAEAVATQRATLLWFGASEMRLVRGPTSSCIEYTTWPANWMSCTASTAAERAPCLERLLLNTADFTRAPFALQLTSVASTLPSAAETPLAVALCYAPSGTVYSAVTNASVLTDTPFTDLSLNSVNGSNVRVGGANGAAVAGGSGLLVRIRMVDTSDGNATVGVLRHVLFPKGTTPRVVQ